MSTEVESTTTIDLPEELSKDLISVLLADQKASLLLRGYLLGKGLSGNITLSGEFKVTFLK